MLTESKLSAFLVLPLLLAVGCDPKGYQKLEDYIRSTYHDADDPVFPASGVYPQ